MTTLELGAPALDALLATIARLDRILVATDFDGTIAPIGLDPATISPVAGAEGALAALAATARTSVAVVSGRTLADLDLRLLVPAGVRVFGSYGAEVRGAAPLVLDRAQRRLWRDVVVGMERLALRYQGSRVEYKTVGASFHVRSAADPDAATAAALALVRSMPGVHVMTGKMVVEAAVRPVSKADTIARLRDELNPYAVVYLGDDDADEEVFDSLQPRDLGIRVGLAPRTSAASISIADPLAAVAVIERLGVLRSGE